MRNRFFKFAAGFISIIAVFALFPALHSFADTIASGTCGDDLTWSLDDNGALTISGSGDMYDWENPGLIPWADYVDDINSVVFVGDITSIGECAFHYCRNIESFSIPDSVASIGEYAFGECSSLSYIAIPNKVTCINNFTFTGCISLSDISLPNSIKEIDCGAFYGCTNLMIFSIPENVTSIGEFAFCGCSNLNSITIPDGVTFIGDAAFWECSNLESISIPEGVDTIGASLFKYCSNLKSVTIPSSVNKIDSLAFSGCTSLSSITIPDSVSEMYYSVFENCTSLTNVTISKNLCALYDGTFEGCTSLKEFILPKNITDIYPLAFAGCNNLQSITMSDKLSFIGEGAFEGCTSLTDVYYNGTREQYERIEGYDAAFSENVTIHCEDALIEINETNFPDDNFRSWVLDNADYNQDGVLSSSEIDQVIEIDCSNLDICDLTGINVFVSIKKLDCSNNKLSSLNIYCCSELLEVYCSYNKIKKINMNKCSKLERFDCVENRLSSLDMRPFKELRILNCPINQLTSLNISGCSNLEELDCCCNKLTSLDIREFDELWNLSCGDNSLTSLDLSNSPGMVLLSCGNNNISDLDISVCHDLNGLNIENAQIESIDLSNCPNLGQLWCGGNRLTSLDISNCKELALLGCENNEINTLDISNCPKLTELRCNNTGISVLNLSVCPNLNFLFCDHNNLTTLDVSCCPMLESLNCSNNDLEELNLDGCSIIYCLYCSYNNLSFLDISDCEELVRAVNSNAPERIDDGLSLHYYVIDDYKFSYDKSVYLITNPKELKISKNPSDYVGVSGSTATFTVKADGEFLSYQWQEYKSGKWVNTKLSGANTDTLSVKVTESRDGYKYRCIVTDYKKSSVTSKSATLSIAPVSISTQPKDFTGKIGDTATFKVEAQGIGLKYQWQAYSSGKWVDSSLPGARTDTLSAGITVSRDGYKFRCIVTDSKNNTATTKSVFLLIAPVSISAQPTDYTGALGSTATFTVEAQGVGLKYQWQVYSSGKWVDSSLTGAKTKSLSVGITNARNGYKFRCAITDNKNKTATSSVVTLHVETVPLTITTQPKDFAGAIGNTATFKIVATGTGLKYQWQVYSSGKWVNSSLSGAKTSTLSVPVTYARNGYKFRCVVTDAVNAKVTSNAVTLKVAAPLSISTQPKDYTGAVGETATFKIVAQGIGLKYQWQVYSSGKWVNSSLTGAKTATLSVPVTNARNGYKFRCVVTDASNSKVTSNAVTLNVSTPLSVTMQPKDYTGAVGSTATFKVAAQGTGLKYQWQVYSSGKWVNSSLTGAKTSTLSVPVTYARNGYRFRCVITDASNAKVTSNSTTLKVSAATLSITTQPKDYTGAIGTTATFNVVAAGSGLKYQWQCYSGGKWVNSSLTGAKSAALSVPVTKARNGYKFRCVITDVSGKTVTSKEVVLKVN